MKYTFKFSKIRVERKNRLETKTSSTSILQDDRVLFGAPGITDWAGMYLTLFVLFYCLRFIFLFFVVFVLTKFNEGAYKALNDSKSA